MQLRTNAPYIVGVDLGGTNVRAALFDREGNKQGQGGRAPSRAREGVAATVAQISLAVDTALKSAGVGRDDVSGIGMGVPGHIDPAGITILWAPNFHDKGQQYRNVPFSQLVQEEIGLPLLMGNDANVAALGEYRFGAGRSRPVKNLVMITLEPVSAGA
jgi:glucokinase